MPESASSRPRVRAAIFDFDGVLADTVPLHYESYRRLFAEEGVEFTFEDYERTAAGAPRARTIRLVLGDEIEPDRFERLMRRKEEIILEVVAREGLEAIPGARELVRALRDRGLRVGMASSSRTAQLFLERMGLAPDFDAVTDARHVRQAKPHPEVYLSTAEKLGVDPRACVAIEDAPVGIESAQAAGMRVIGVATTAEREKLAAADWVVDALSEVDVDAIVGRRGE